MTSENKNYSAEYFEEVFRNSTSPDEIFDMLTLAIRKNIRDRDLYKILLANPVLSNDEIIMYTEKLCKEFTECAYELYHWTGYLFQMRDTNLSLIENALYYYRKAFLINPEDYQPLLSTLSLYNYEINTQTNSEVLKLVNTGLIKVKRKSIIYDKLSKHYRKLENAELARKFAILAQQASKSENQ